MKLLESTVGRKLVMAVTGFSMLAFVIVHLLGNSTIYAGPDGINAYAEALHSLGPLVFVFRLVLFIMFYLHIFYGIQLAVENRAAKPWAYSVGKNLTSTFAGRNMIWTGLVIGVFVIFHLLHFTLQVVDPAAAAKGHLDAMGRPDVFMMVSSGFRKLFIAVIYICAMGVLGLHLGHSIQSGFQTAGLNSEKSLPLIMKGGMVAAILISVGYISFPVSIFAGILR